MRHIRNSLSTPAAGTSVHSGVYASAQSKQKVWVTTWVDYSAKYGLGYMLSNGAVGVYFNDSTKMILSSDGSKFEYIDRAETPGAQAAYKAATLGGGSAPTPCGLGRYVLCADGTTRISANLTMYPDELRKKVILIKHFQQYLLEQYNKRKAATADGTVYHNQGVLTVRDGSIPAAPADTAFFAVDGTVASCGMLHPVSVEEQNAVMSGSPSANMVFMKRFVRTQRCLLFRMSDSSIQICFFDGTAAHVSADGATATFTERNGYRSAFSTKAVLVTVARKTSSTPADGDHDHEITVDVAKRLRYLKDVLTTLTAINQGSRKDGATGTAPQ
jgi:polo-like kinase 1